MRTIMLSVAVVCVFISTSVAQQEQKQSNQSNQYQATVTDNVKVGDKVILSSESTTVRVANLNETVAVDGRVLRVSDLMAVLSSDNLLAPRPRSQENQTPAESQPIPPRSEKR